MTKNDITWDMSSVFPSVTDPTIDKTIDKINEMVTGIIANYQGKIEKLSAKGLLKLLQDYEEYLIESGNIGMYARLSFAANMTLPETQQLTDRMSKIQAQYAKELAFISLDVGKLVYNKKDLIEDPILSNYKHFLERLVRVVPHQLSEIEEQLIIGKDQFGIRGWQQLQSKWLNTRMFDVEVEGEMKQLSYGQANALLPHKDRETRKSANKSIYGLLRNDSEIFSSAMRNIFNDWEAITVRRKYDSEMHASLIANDISQEVITNLLKAIDEHSHIYRRYLKLKAKMLGLPKLANYDITAPLPDAPDIKYDFKKAEELVTDAYSKFDEEYAFATKDMFKRKHIDASPRFGKRNGAFCASWYKGKSAFILQSFNDALGGVYTLAHELGHATHDYYFIPAQTILNSRTPMVVAETASIFGELLLTDLLMSQAQTDNEKKAIICQVLDGAGMAAFQVTARAWFEQDVYDAIKRGEYLDFKTISKYWKKNRDRIYGDAIEWLDEMEAEWTMKGHYYMPNFRFYNYPYVYAQMFVYALYQKYIEEGKDFVPKFKKVLSAGSSLSPIEIGKLVGLDVTDPDFWKLGMKRFEHFVDELEKLVK